MADIQPIKTLKINDGEKSFEVEAKATFFFDQVAEKFAKETEDENGKKITTPGFNAIFNGILDFDTDSIANFWECATAYLKERPTREQIEQAIFDIIDEKQDTIELLQGALDVMNNSGFFKRKARQFWKQMNQATKMSKEEDKEMTEIGVQMLKDNYTEIMGVEPYLTTVKSDN